MRIFSFLFNNQINFDLVHNILQYEIIVKYLVIWIYNSLEI
jgi:hypothetical protein